MHPVENIWTTLMLKICKHTLYAYLSRIWKSMQFTRFIQKIFVTKILPSGNFLFFSDSDQKDKKQNWFQSQGKFFLEWASILFQKMILIPFSSKININRFSKLKFTPFFLTNQSHLSKYTSSQNLFYSPPPLQLRSLPVNFNFVLCCFNWTHCIGNLKPWRGHNFPVHHFWGTFFSVGTPHKTLRLNCCWFCNLYFHCWNHRNASLEALPLFFERSRKKTKVKKRRRPPLLPSGCHMPVRGSIITDLNPSPGRSRGTRGSPPHPPLNCSNTK